MRKVFIIGIGAGNPDYITVQAINALNAVDVFFVMEKGRETEDLVRLRKEICERHIKDKSYRTIQVRDPERDRTSPSYESGVKAWHEQRANSTTARYGSLIRSLPEEPLHRSQREERLDHGYLSPQEDYGGMKLRFRRRPGVRRGHWRHVAVVFPMRLSSH